MLSANNHCSAFHAALSAFSIMLLSPQFLPTTVEQNLCVLERAVSVLKNLDSVNHKMGHSCSQYVQLLISTVKETGELPRFLFITFVMHTKRLSIRTVGMGGTDKSLSRSRARSPVDQRAAQQAARIGQDGPFNIDNVAFGDDSDIDLGQFFSTDQIDLFGLDEAENSMFGREDRYMAFKYPMPLVSG